MLTYKLEEFSQKTGVDKKILQKWDKLGVLVADRNSKNRRVYTDKHYEKYLEFIGSSKEKEDNTNLEKIKTEILIKKEKEDDNFIVLIKHLITNQYIEVNRLKTYKNARISAVKKKEELEKIGIEVIILKQIERI